MSAFSFALNNSSFLASVSPSVCLIDSIFIFNGVHRSEFERESDLGELYKKYKVSSNYYQPELAW